MPSHTQGRRLAVATARHRPGNVRTVGLDQARFGRLPGRVRKTLGG